MSRTVFDNNLAQLEKSALQQGWKIQKNTTLYDYRSRKELRITAAVYNRNREPLLVAAPGKASLQLLQSHPAIRYCIDLDEPAAPVYDTRRKSWLPLSFLTPTTSAVRPRSSDRLWRILIRLTAAGVLFILLLLLL